MTPTDLLGGARRILDGNREPTYTVPSRQLYPHQWSWDSAFTAIGWAHVEPSFARLELDTLFGAQWADGRLPHIAFNPDVGAASYFPGPGFWAATDRSADGRPTSGIVQPPIHAAAVLRVADAVGAGPQTTEWLARIYPRLCAWHAYLSTHRTMPGRELVSILHPWESGMDNSPMWDSSLRGVDPTRGRATRYERRDLAHTDAADRPTNDDYDRYVALVVAYRDGGYDDAIARRDHEFVVECPLFNAALAWSNLALAQIAERIGVDGAQHRRDATRTTQALTRDLYSSDGYFGGHDVRAGLPAPAVTVSGLLPLLLPDLPVEVVEQVVATARLRFGLGARSGALPSIPYDERLFDPNRYWRGPTWVSTNWLAIVGLRTHGLDADADRLAVSTLDLIDTAGFYEYVNPVTGHGRGSPDFSWTAALAIDLLSR